MAVFSGGITADAEGLGIGPSRRSEEDLGISISKNGEREVCESLCEESGRMLL